jgi:hypothetical protein
MRYLIDAAAGDLNGQKSLREFRVSWLKTGWKGEGSAHFIPRIILANIANMPFYKVVNRVQWLH